jgi:hypothetical protein
MAITYDKVATATVSGGSTDSIDFTSISASYTDLVLILNHASASASGLVYLTLNNDTTNNNYSQTRITWDSSGYGGDIQAAANNINQRFIGWTRTGWATTVVNVMNYSNTDILKCLIHRNSNAQGSGQVASAQVTLWRNTAAINRITIVQSSGIYFTAGTMATIYGIAKA